MTTVTTDSTEAKSNEKNLVTRWYGQSRNSVDETASISLPTNSDAGMNSKIGAYAGRMAFKRHPGSKHCDTVALAFVFDKETRQKYAIIEARIAIREGESPDRNIQLKKFVDEIAIGICRIIDDSNKIKLRKEEDAEAYKKNEIKWETHRVDETKM